MQGVGWVQDKKERRKKNMKEKSYRMFPNTPWSIICMHAMMRQTHHVVEEADLEGDIGLPRGVELGVGVGGRPVVGPQRHANLVVQLVVALQLPGSGRGVYVQRSQPAAVRGSRLGACNEAVGAQGWPRVRNGTRRRFGAEPAAARADSEAAQHTRARALPAWRKALQRSSRRSQDYQCKRAIRAGSCDGHGRAMSEVGRA